jgi:RNA polymerase sigma-70 factor, ECF subfamily
MSLSGDANGTADVELLHRAASGDKDAFGVVFERYQHVVYRFARAMTGSSDAAEDIAQEVFVVLIRDLRRYAPERATLSTYLYGIARNLSRERLRRERRLLACVTGLPHLREVVAIDPVDHVADAERKADVRRALASLPVRYREVVILCDLHDLSYADVGTILRTSIGAVRSRLHRGRQLLRQRLAAATTLTGRQLARSSVRCSA